MPKIGGSREILFLQSFLLLIVRDQAHRLRPIDGWSWLQGCNAARYLKEDAGKAGSHSRSLPPMSSENASLRGPTDACGAHRGYY